MTRVLPSKRDTIISERMVGDKMQADLPLLALYPTPRAVACSNLDGFP
jgi:hypothetical protein